MQGTDDSAEDGQDDVENDFEYESIANKAAMLSRLSKGWTAYLVAVLPATEP